MRIELLNREAARSAAEALGVPEGMTRLSIFQLLLRHPKLARPFNDLLMCLLFEGSLDARLRELVIMRTGWVTGSVYEWTQHWSIAQLLGVDADDILGVRDWHSDDGQRFSAAERAALGAVDDVARDGEISASTWEQIRKAFPSDSDQIELAMLVATYSAISTFLRSTAVPLEEGIDPWPPDGTHPG